MHAHTANKRRFMANIFQEILYGSFKFKFENLTLYRIAIIVYGNLMKLLEEINLLNL